MMLWLAQATQNGGTFTSKDLVLIIGALFTGLGVLGTGLLGVYLKWLRKPHGQHGRPFIIKAILTELPEMAAAQIANHEERIERNEEEVASLGREVRDGQLALKEHIDQVSHNFTRRQDRANFILTQLATRSGIPVPPLEDEGHNTHPA